MTKMELQQILNQVNNATVDQFTEYVSIVKQAIEKLQSIQQEDKSPMLDAWLGMGLEEMRKDLSQRLNGNFLSLPLDKQKTELMYSKSTVSMSLTNVLMHL